VVAELLRRLVGPGRSAVVATHDPRLLPIADRVVDLTPSPVAPPVDRSGLEEVR
jgi:ABC-type lipoprotein export system ATPase subunit